MRGSGAGSRQDGEPSFCRAEADCEDGLGGDRTRIAEDGAAGGRWIVGKVAQCRRGNRKDTCCLWQGASGAIQRLAPKATGDGGWDSEAGARLLLLCSV